MLAWEDAGWEREERQEAMNEIGLEMVKWVQERRTPGADEFFLGLTAGGEWFGLLSVLGLLFWLFGARAAYRAGFALAAGDLLSGAVKNLFCVPRPWVRDMEIVPVRAAQAGAFGYSFPSGHASSLAFLWGGIGATLKKGWAWIPLLAWIGLAGFSRVYLGVHTPLDVAGSWLLAIPTVWAAGRAADWAEANPEKAWRVLAAGALLAGAGALFMRLRPVPEDALPTFGRDVYRSAWALVGFVGAWYAERRWIRYDPARLGGYRALAGAAGVLVLWLMLGNLRRLLGPWLGENGSMYGLAVAIPLWIFVVWPLLLKGLEKPAEKPAGR